MLQYCGKRRCEIVVVVVVVWVVCFVCEQHENPPCLFEEAFLVVDVLKNKNKNKNVYVCVS